MHRNEGMTTRQKNNTDSKKMKAKIEVYFNSAICPFLRFFNFVTYWKLSLRTDNDKRCSLLYFFWIFLLSDPLVKENDVYVIKKAFSFVSTLI